MWKKITLVSLCLALVVGCGDKDAEQVKAINKDAGEGQQHVAEQKSGTAIYFPGGVGVDFGKKPDRVIDKEKHSVLVYELQAEYKEIDKGLSDIFKLEAYKRIDKGAAGNYEQRIVYSKKGQQPILVRYRSFVREGFEKGTRVYISWKK